MPYLTTQHAALERHAARPAARLRAWWSRSAPHGEFWKLVPATLLFNLGISIYLFLYNLFMLDLGFTERPLAIFASSLALGTMVGTIPMGIFARRYGFRKVLFACLLISSFAFAARVCLIWYPAQLAFAFLDGAMLAGWSICIPPAIAEVVPEDRRPFAFGALFGLAIAGCSLGGLIGGNLPGLCQHWVAVSSGRTISTVEGKRLTLLFSSAVTGLAAWPVFRLRRSAPLRTLRLHLRPSRFLLHFLAAYAVWGAALGLFNPFTNLFFGHYLGVPTAHLGNFFSVALVIQSVAVVLSSFLFRRTGLMRGVFFTQIATAAALAALSLWHSILRAEIFYCAFMAAQNMTQPAIQNLLMDRIAPEDRSSASSMSLLVLSIAQASAAAVAAWAYGHFSYPQMIASTAVAVGCAAFFFQTLRTDLPAPEDVRPVAAVRSGTVISTDKRPVY